MEGGLPLSAWAQMLDAARPPTRPGGVRGRSVNLGTTVVRVPSLSADVRFNDELAVPDMPRNDAPASDTATLRAPYGDNLSSIGLPGEEAATFVPLVIEPYDPPAVPTPAHSPGPTSNPQVHLSPSAAAATSSSPFSSPRPPAGAAVPRVASGRRTLWRQLSQSTAPDTGNHSPRVASVISVPLKPWSVTAVAATVTPTAPTSSVPSSASTVAATAELLSTAVSSPFPVGDLPVVVFDGSAALASDGKGTAAYLDPSKPAVRRLLPPLLHTTQPLCEDAVLDATSPGGVDNSAPGGAGAAANGSRGNSRSNSVSISANASTGTNRSATFGTLVGSGTPSPSGTCTTSCTTGSPGLHGCGDVDDCIVSAADLLPHTPPCDSHDSPPSARRRPRPAPDSLRSSAVSVDSISEGWAEVEVPRAAAAAVAAASAASCSSSSRANPTGLTKGMAVCVISGGGLAQGREIEEPSGPFRQHSSLIGAGGDGEDGDTDGDPSQALARALAGLPVASDTPTAARGEGLAPPLAGTGQQPPRLDLSRLSSRSLLLAGAGREVLSPSGSLGGSCASPRGTPAGASRPSTAALPPISSRSSSRRQTSSQ